MQWKNVLLYSFCAITGNGMTMWTKCTLVTDGIRRIYPRMHRNIALQCSREWKASQWELEKVGGTNENQITDKSICWITSNAPVIKNNDPPKLG